MNHRKTFFLPAKPVPAGLVCAVALCLFALRIPAQTLSPLNLPLYFEGNQGQTEFLARGTDYEFLISPAGAQIVLRKSAAEPATVRMQFVGANAPAEMRGDAKMPGKINYLIGDDSTKWQTGVATFSKVCVQDIYPGVNLIYYGNQRQLEYDFTVAPGANPNAIGIRFNGVDKASVNAQDELVLKIGDGEIRQPKPVIYQMVDGARKEIAGGYKISDYCTVAFEIGKYDPALPLVIDPVLSYSTYFGGTAGDTAWAVAINTNDGSIYVAGQTLSKQFVTNGPPFSTTNAFQTNFQGGSLDGDAFVAKFDNLGTNLIYLTYLGGSANEGAYGIAVDGSGDAYVTGYTDSTNFPTTAGVISRKINGKLDPVFGYYPVDIFVAELNPGGSNLIYSTYLGGNAPDYAKGIALDSSGNAYIAGFTYSTNFPTSTNALQKHLACTNDVYFNANAFVTEISPKGTNLIYSTYLGGSNFDGATSIAVDGSNYVYVAGYTASTNFPTWNTPTNLPGATRLNGSTDKKNNSAFDAFVAKFPPLNVNPPTSVTNLIYSTYLGGTNSDMAYGIAADSFGCAYVTGGSSSTNFPNTAKNVPGLFSYEATNTLSPLFVTNVFLTKISSDGTAVVYSALFGGKTNDVGYGVAVDSLGDAFVVGATSSTNFPTTNTFGFLRATNSGANDVFVTAFNTNCTALLYSVRLGGKGNDFGYGIALDSSNDAYIVGQTLSTNFPTLDARQTFRNGTNDAFLAKIILTVMPPEITIQPPTNQTVGAGSTVTFAVTATGTTPLNYQWQIVGTNLIGTNLVNGGRISGATNATLTISNAETNDSGNYLVIVTNYAGSVTSSVAILTVTDSPPVIIMQPTNQTVGVGSVVTFAVTATGTEPLSYHWQIMGTNLIGTNLVNGGRISGATNAMLTISNAQTNDSGNYLVIVTNDAGSATSSNAVLTVLSAPDFTGIMTAGGSNGIILSGVGGTNNGAYFVLTSSNLLEPLDLWTRIATNHFGSQGQFIFTNILQTNVPQLFYILQLP